MVDLALLIVAVFQILLENNHNEDVEIGILKDYQDSGSQGAFKTYIMERIFKFIFPT